MKKEDLSNEDFNVATYVKGSSVKMRKYKEKDSISNLSVFFSNYWGCVHLDLLLLLYHLF